MSQIPRMEAEGNQVPPGTETSGMNLASQLVVGDAVNFELPEASPKGQNEPNLAKEDLKIVEKGLVPAIETSGMCLESHHVATDAVEDELQDFSSANQTEVKLGNEIMQALEYEVPLEISLHSDLELCPANDKEVLHEQKAEKSLASDVENGTDQHVKKVREPVNEQKGVAGYSISHVEDKVHNFEGSEEKIHYSVASNEIMLPETENEAPVFIENFLSSNVEKIGPVCASFVGGPRSQIMENVPCDHESLISTANYASSASDSAVDTVVCTKADSFLQGDDAQVDGEVSSGTAEASSWLPAATSKAEILDSFDVDEEGTSNIKLGAAGIKDMGDKLIGASGNDDSGNLTTDKSRASEDGSIAESIAGGHANVEALTKPFNYLIRIPRFNTDVIREQIRLAKLQVDEKTNARNAIQLQIREKRASCQIYGLDFEYAKGLDRRARKLVRLKRMEINAIDSKINRAHNAIAIEAIDEKVYSLEYRMQHETLPLKEEKLLTRDIKLLKYLRDQLSAKIGSQDEIQEALEHRIELEDCLKIRRKELNVLKERAIEAEAAVVDTEVKYANEIRAVKDLRAQLKAVSDARQAAYARWHSLREELAEKNKEFFNYKDNAAAARNQAYNRDTEALCNLCKNQLEQIMELWNTNNQFRKDYIRFNERSTTRRFGTLDGRSLGPDEEPLILPIYVSERIISTPGTIDSTSKNPMLELNQETTAKKLSDDELIKREHKMKVAKNKGPSEPAFRNVLATFSRRDVTDVHEELWRSSGEEIELAGKEEEMRRELAEAQFREQRRLEALSKAEEARERKKRQAEKIQMRAELKSQKEAEEKEKEREKRLKKKERKKAAATDGNGSNNRETAVSSEGSVDSNEMGFKGMLSSVTAKKPKKPSVFVKQSKVKSIPPALRNRSKKKWQHYAWVCFTCILILVLFWLGNVGMFSNVNLRRRSPVY